MFKIFALLALICATGASPLTDDETNKAPWPFTKVIIARHPLELHQVRRPNKTNILKIIYRYLLMLSTLFYLKESEGRIAIIVNECMDLILSEVNNKIPYGFSIDGAEFTFT
jgi:hypothetical protein